MSLGMASSRGEGEGDGRESVRTWFVGAQEDRAHFKTRAPMQPLNGRETSWGVAVGLQTGILNVRGGGGKNIEREGSYTKRGGEGDITPSI